CARQGCPNDRKRARRARLGDGMEILQGVWAGLTSPHAHRRLQGEHENLAIPDVAGSSAVTDHLDNTLGDVSRHRHLELDLWDIGNLIFSAAVNLPMALLAAKTANFGYGKTLDTGIRQGFSHWVEPVGLNNRNDVAHGLPSLRCYSRFHRE